MHSLFYFILFFFCSFLSILANKRLYINDSTKFHFTIRNRIYFEFLTPIDPRIEPIILDLGLSGVLTPGVLGNIFLLLKSFKNFRLRADSGILVTCS